MRGQPLGKRQLESALRETLWLRITDRAGYVLVQNYFLYAERAANRQRVCLWLWDDTLHIDYQDEVLASYACSYDQKTHQIKKLGEPTLYENRFSRQQPQLLQIGPEQWQRITQRHKGQRRRMTTDPTQRQLPGIAVQK